MPLVYLPSSQLQFPSYRTTFARNKQQAKYPNLWDGLVGLWAPYLGSTYNIVKDWSGNRNHGTLTDMDPATDWVVDRYGRTLDFSSVASSDYVIWTGSLPASVNAWSAVWLCDFRSVTATYRLPWGVITSGLAFYGSLDRVYIRWTVGETTFLAAGVGGQHFWSLTYDGTTARLGRDGLFTNQAASGKTMDWTTVKRIGQKFDGTIGLVAFWNRVLSDSEVLHFNRDPHALLRPKDIIFPVGGAGEESVYADHIFIVSWPLLIQTPKQSTISWKGVLSSSNNADVSWLNELSDDYVFIVEHLNNVSLDSQSVVDWLNNLSVDEVNIISWIAHSLRNNTNVISWIGNLVSNQSSALSWLSAIAGNNNHVLDWLLDISSDNEEVISWFQRLAVANIATISWLNEIAKNNTNVLDWLYSISKSDTTVVSWLQNIVKDGILNVSYDGASPAVTSDNIFNIDYTLRTIGGTWTLTERGGTWTLSGRGKTWTLSSRGKTWTLENR